jgi:hypothetical protein
MQIGEAEAAGDVAFLSDLVASRLAFRRVNGVCQDREEFLRAVNASATRRTDVLRIEFFGRDRAVVECVVTTTDGPEASRVHNLRMFVRDRFGAWKLLGWANGRVAEG